jgi:hypothetical protein
MKNGINRRLFLKTASIGSALCLKSADATSFPADTAGSNFVHSVNKRTKVRVCRLYLANPKGLWPKPGLDLQEEMRRYDGEFAKLKDELSDIDFVENRLITLPEQVNPIKNTLSDADGILVIHLQLGIIPILNEVLSVRKPTVVYAVPYSGHEWTQFGALRNQEQGALLECLLTGDYRELAAAVRPFRAICHLKNATILNLKTSAVSQEYVTGIKDSLGTTIKVLERQRVLNAYNAVKDAEAEKEAQSLISGAEKVVEPTREEIVKSCRLALAFQKILEEEDATVMTVDCYGSMYQQLPAFPCIGFHRLQNMGLGGICESDLKSSMTHLIFQGLTGRPGFVNDPTMDVSRNSIILAHCLGSTKMDGPQKESAPYKIRSIMERQAGAVVQARMRIGQRVTQAILVGSDHLRYFTGEIIDTPESDRGCRTKITVRVDGDAEKLWKNWSSGLHRVTCYGDLTKDLERFCRFKGITMVNEA